MKKVKQKKPGRYNKFLGGLITFTVLVGANQPHHETGEYPPGQLIVAGAMLGLILIGIGFKQSISAKKAEQRTLNEQETLETSLANANLNIDKKIKLGTGATQKEFLVDGSAKKFAYSAQGEGLKVFTFEQLKDFDLQEDGVTVVEGRGGKTLAGGLVFGAVGALAGAMGEKTTSTKCNHFVIRLKINDLNSPLISYPLLEMETQKHSPIYNQALEQAEEIIATLEFIKDNR